MISQRHFWFIVLLFVPCVFPSKSQFQHWYPEYRDQFKRLLRENCTEEYDFYLAGQKNMTRYLQTDIWQGSTYTSQVAFPPAACILNGLSEFMKFNMAGAAVLLGLTPSILAALGPTVEEMSTLYIIARRPVLGIVLAAGAPSLYPFRAVNYEEVLGSLHSRQTVIRPRRFSRAKQNYITAGKFVLAAGAIVNNATNSYQLGMQTICVFAPHIWYLPILWAFLGILAHTYGAWALWMRVRCMKPNESFRVWVVRQFTPLDAQEKLEFEPVEETIWSVVVAWWVTVNIACHIIFGTLAFSSFIFITVRDALTVIARYMASLLVCRGIMTYELMVLKDTYRDGSDELPETRKLVRMNTQTDSVVSASL